MPKQSPTFFAGTEMATLTAIAAAVAFVVAGLYFGERPRTTTSVAIGLANLLIGVVDLLALL